jgi:hypothetical protein
MLIVCFTTLQLVNEKDAYTVTTSLSISNVATSSPSSAAISRVVIEIEAEH